MVLITVRNEVAKVMFLHVSVSHSVHRKGRLLSQHALQVVSQHALQQGGLLLGGVPTPGGCSPGRSASGGGACSKGGLLWKGGGVETPPKADGYCCGRYASYWNAFLFGKISIQSNATY